MRTGIVDFQSVEMNHRLYTDQRHQVDLKPEPRSAWQPLKWAVWRVVLVTADDDDLLRRLVPRRYLAQLHGDLQAVQGLFVAGGDGPLACLELSDTETAERLVRAVLQLELSDVKAVTNFLNTWGKLGVGPVLWDKPPLPALAGRVFGQLDTSDCAPESLGRIRQEITKFRQHVDWLERLKQRGTTREWEKFAESLDRPLRHLHPTIRLVPGVGASPAFSVQTPADMLWATLWDWATRGGRLRRCRHCDALFLAADPRKVYCSIICTNRASAMRWYRKKGRKKRRAQRLAKASQ
jgi:hypothetical protein